MQVSHDGDALALLMQDSYNESRQFFEDYAATYERRESFRTSAPIEVPGKEASACQLGSPLHSPEPTLRTPPLTRVLSDDNVSELFTFVRRPLDDLASRGSGSVGSLSVDVADLSMTPLGHSVKMDRFEDNFAGFRVLPSGNVRVVERVYGGRTVSIEATREVLACGMASTVYVGRLSIKDAEAEDKAHAGQTPHACDVDRLVAVKVWYGQYALSGGVPAIITRLQMIMSMSHPGVVPYRYLCFTIARRGRREGANVTASSSSAATQPAPDLRSVVVVDYAGGGSLAKLVKERGRFSESEVRQVLYDIVPALRYMHEDIGMAHNDVKPHNILLFRAEDEVPPRQRQASAQRSHYKLIDFATANCIQPRAALAATFALPRQKLLQQSAERSIFAGTWAFMSPESCLGIDTSATVDVWSLGVTVFYMATGRVPWSAMEMSYPNIILNGFRSRYAIRGFDTAAVSLTTDSRAASVTTETASSSRLYASVSSAGAGSDRENYATFGPVLDELDGGGFSPQLRDLVQRCLTINPFDRITCEQLMQHPFMHMSPDT